MPVPAPLKEREWNLLLYMSVLGSAGKKKSDEEKEKDRDLKNLQSVGSNKHVNVVVQCRKPRTYKPADRYYVRNGSLEHCGRVKASLANLGDPQALIDFVKWADKCFPSRKTFLIMWGHGYGVHSIFVYDLKQDWLQIPELAQALRQLARERGKLDVLGFDACNMQTVEVAYQLRDYVKYTVGSAVGTPRNAWQYAELLKKVKKGVKKADSGPKAVARMVLNCMKKSDKRDDQTILSVLDLEKSDELVGAIAKLVKSLKRAYDSKEKEKKAAEALQKAAWIDWRQLPDLGDVCARLAEAAEDRQVKRWATRVRNLLLDRGGFVAGTALTDKRLRTPTGVSIFVPRIKVSGETAAEIKLAAEINTEVKEKVYRWLEFTATRWADWAFSLPAMEERVEEPCLWFRQTPCTRFHFKNK